MKILLESKGGFNNITNWLKKSPTTSNYRGILEKYGKYGVEQLKMSTPSDTGETANGWDYRIIQNGANQLELYFINTAHPELEVNLAKLIQLGHGTRTGGYVPPVNYIHPTMSKVYKQLGQELIRRFKL